MNRVARVERLTRETQIMIELDLDGIGVVEVGTGVPFFDHMLAQLGKHGGADLTVRAKGDVEIDAHHTVEDTAITLGQALREALGDRSGIARFGDALVPLDETLVQAANAPTPGTASPSHSSAASGCAVTSTCAPARSSARCAERRFPDP